MELGLRERNRCTRHGFLKDERRRKREVETQQRGREKTQGKKGETEGGQGGAVGASKGEGKGGRPRRLENC